MECFFTKNKQWKTISQIIILNIFFLSYSYSQNLPQQTQKSSIQNLDIQVRIKDLVEVRGVRSNQLTGLGIVVGLAGTGDSKASIATNKSIAMTISRLGISVNPLEVTTKNIALVAITADLPPFARIGDHLNIRLSSIGDAASLEGGTLLFTSLKGADNRPYATAQGTISQGSSMAGSEGGGGQGTRNNAPKTVALAGGALVEREFASTFVSNNNIELSLTNPDFTTASRVALALNEYFGEFIADPVNAGLIVVKLPSTVAKNNPSFNPVTFISLLEQIKITPDVRASVVINERTGTIIAGQNVIISPVAISHGRLEILVSKKSQKVTELQASTTVSDLVQALNLLGAGPKDIVAIIQTLKASNALKAEIKIL